MLAPLLLLADDGDDLVVPALHGDRQRTRRVAVRIDADERIGAMLHEHTHQLRGVCQHRDMQRAASTRQLGPGLQHRPHLRQIAGAYGRHQPLVGRAHHV